MPWWGLGIALLTAGLAIFLVVWLKLLPTTVTTLIDLHSGRLNYTWRVCNIPTREVIVEAPLSRSIKDYRGAYHAEEEWALVIEYRSVWTHQSENKTPLYMAHHILQNFHNNYFRGAWKQQPNRKSFSPEVRAVTAERTLAVLRETMDFEEAQMYQCYVAYQVKDIDPVEDVELIPSAEEYYESGFDDPTAYMN